MKTHGEWLLLAAGNLILLAVTAIVNDGLARWSISLFTAGLCMVLPALRLGPGALLLCALCTGLPADAQLPTPPGFLTTLFVLGAGLIILTRSWLGHAGRKQFLALAWVLNGFYFAGFTLWATWRAGAGGWGFWERVAVDFCLSQIILVPVAAWFFDLEDFLLRSGGFAAGARPGPARS